MNKAQKRAQHLRQAFNLTPSEWDQILAHQGGVCFICEEPIKGHPHTDHNHKTGQVRGILCSSCNRGLGKIEDPRWKFDVKRLLRVINYFLSPPATSALGRQIFGFPGRLTHRGKPTKRYKQWIKKSTATLDATSARTK